MRTSSSSSELRSQPPPTRRRSVRVVRYFGGVPQEMRLFTETGDAPSRTAYRFSVGLTGHPCVVPSTPRPAPSKVTVTLVVPVGSPWMLRMTLFAPPDPIVVCRPLGRSTTDSRPSRARMSLEADVRDGIVNFNRLPADVPLVPSESRPTAFPADPVGTAARTSWTPRIETTRSEPRILSTVINERDGGGEIPTSAKKRSPFGGNLSADACVAKHAAVITARSRRAAERQGRARLCIEGIMKSVTPSPPESSGKRAVALDKRDSAASRGQRQRHDRVCHVGAAPAVTVT